MVDDQSVVQFQAKLLRFYTKYNPEKADATEVVRIVQSYAGSYDILETKLRAKYGESPSDLEAADAAAFASSGGRTATESSVAALAAAALAASMMAEEEAEASGALEATSTPSISMTAGLSSLLENHQAAAASLPPPRWGLTRLFGGGGGAAAKTVEGGDGAAGSGGNAAAATSSAPPPSLLLDLDPAALVQMVESLKVQMKVMHIENSSLREKLATACSERDALRDAMGAASTSTGGDGTSGNNIALVPSIALASLDRCLALAAEAAAAGGLDAFAAAAASGGDSGSSSGATESAAAGGGGGGGGGFDDPGVLGATPVPPYWEKSK